MTPAEDWCAVEEDSATSLTGETRIQSIPGLAFRNVLVVLHAA